MGSLRVYCSLLYLHRMYATSIHGFFGKFYKIKISSVTVKERGECKNSSGEEEKEFLATEQTCHPSIHSPRDCYSQRLSKFTASQKVASRRTFQTRSHLCPSLFVSASPPTSLWGLTMPATQTQTAESVAQLGLLGGTIRCQPAYTTSIVWLASLFRSR